MNSKPIALITGATSGIGKACAELLATNNFQLILTGRRTERLVELKQNLEKQFAIKVLILTLDVRNREAVELAFSSLPKEWQSIDVLINNAGLAMGLSSIENGNIDHWDTMIDTNLKGLLYVTKNVVPYMIEHKKGHIVNVGSIAGKEVYANGNVYCATKHAVDALNRSMRLDLSKYPIRVSAIHPGAVETEFSVVRFEGDEVRAKTVYEGFENLVATDVAEAVWFMLNRPPHVNINEMTIMPTAQPMAGVINRK
ncbi:MAG: SDR family NAD(P)-dependent oxidoreductase [bacterium]|nr:SDR family NAD(P)-dependent oxidoreductase [bacterium]